MKLKYWLALLIVLGGCKEKYVVNVHTPARGYLVVEGFINIAGTTNIMMSRSSGLDTPRVIPEPGAEVEIQTLNGTIYVLTEIAAGYYAADDLFLDPTQQYRLHIITANGKDYTSDYSVAKITPPIDSVNWVANNNGVNIYVSTHDDQSQPGYYQWAFEETWKYHSAYSSDIKYEDHEIQSRPISEEFYTCYRTDLSTQISISNTEKLSSNVIYQYLLTQVPYGTTNKLIDRYSILVKQYAITKDWYEWSQKVKKNTEQVGSIFDAQPSETGGNIHCTTDPTEPVIGFIGSTTETQTRIFIDRLQLPSTIVFSGYESCELITSKNDSATLANYFSDPDSNIPTEPVYSGITIIGIDGSTANCVDCRLHGGTTIQPSFWQ